MNIDSNMVLKTSTLDNMRWIDPLYENVKIYGLNWINTNKSYKRIPDTYLEQIKPVNERVAILSRNSSGVQLHFVSNTKKLVIHAKVSDIANISGMTFVGQCGFDCYVGTNYDNLLFYNTARFEIGKNEYEFTLFEDESAESKLVVINFPLYATVDGLQLAIDEGAYVKKPQENLSNNGKIVYYGTSITQGGCASRPGLSYTNIISRKMKLELINFGFSGNAFGEKEVAMMMSDISDASMFVIDYEANGGLNGKLEATLEEFIKIIRLKKVNTPIVVISRIKYLFDDLKPRLGKRREELRLFQENMVKRFIDKGDNHLYYIDGSKLLGEHYDEYTIDAIHPNDLGFMEMAKNLIVEFKRISEIEVKKNGK